MLSSGMCWQNSSNTGRSLDYNNESGVKIVLKELSIWIKV
jgi:hypothetical protein